MTNDAASAQEELARLEGYLAADPGNPQLLLRAVDVALAAGDTATARRHVDGATLVRPADPYVQHRHANVLLAEGRLEEAGTIYASLLARHRDPHIAFNLALVRFRQGRLDDALNTLMPLTDASPQPSVVLGMQALHRLGRVKDAAEIVRRELTRCGGSPAFLAVASLVLFDDDELAQAEELARTSLAKGPRLLEALVVSGYAALARRDTGVAQQFFEEAMRLNGREPRTLAGLGMTRLLTGDAQGARELLEQAVQALPDNIEMLQALGWAHLMARDATAAEQAFTKLAKLPEGTDEAQGGLAVAYALDGRREDAAKALARLKPGDPAAPVAQALIDGDAQAIAQLQALAAGVLGRP